MNFIISNLINFLNRINKFIWKIIVFLSKFIKINDNPNVKEQPTDERYRRFKVDEPPFIEKSSSLELKDFKQLIKDNNIKPVKRRKLLLMFLALLVVPLKIFFTIIMVNNLSLNVKFVLMFFL